MAELTRREMWDLCREAIEATRDGTFLGDAIKGCEAGTRDAAEENPFALVIMGAWLEKLAALRAGKGGE